MSKWKWINRLGDDLVSITSIISLTILALNGFTDPYIVSIIAGLGGYSLRNKVKKAQLEKQKKD